MIDPRENLKAYLDNELEPLEAEAVRVAIQQDRRLAAEAEKFLAISNALRQELPVAVHGLDEALAALREREAKRRPNLVWIWTGAAASLAAIVLGVAVWPLLTPSRMEREGLVTASFAKNQAMAAAPVAETLKADKQSQPRVPMSESADVAKGDRYMNLNGAKDGNELSRPQEKSQEFAGYMGDYKRASRRKEAPDMGALSAKRKVDPALPDFIVGMRKTGATVEIKPVGVIVTARLSSEADLRKIWGPYAKQDRREILADGKVRLTLKTLVKP